MPSTSAKQARFMAAVAHNPAFAKRAGVPQSVGREFNQADAGTGILKRADGGITEDSITAEMARHAAAQRLRDMQVHRLPRFDMGGGVGGGFPSFGDSGMKGSGGGYGGIPPQVQQLLARVGQGGGGGMNWGKPPGFTDWGATPTPSTPTSMPQMPPQPTPNPAPQGIRPPGPGMAAGGGLEDKLAYSSLPSEPPRGPSRPPHIKISPPIRGPYPHEPYPGISPGKPGERLSGMAAGGMPTAPWYERGAMYHLNRMSSGMQKSSVPGRTDKLNLNVAPGSYVMPADTVSHLGQNNSMAGAKMMDRLFNAGPRGANLGLKGRGRAGRMFMSGMADGGEAQPEGGGEEVPIMAAGGEYVLTPEQVANVGGGDIKKGHQILDNFVKLVREKHIKTLRKLPPPKK